MKTGLSRIPSFALYGEGPRSAGARLHVEDIQSRSRRYLWEIAPHVHHDLYQCILIVRGPATIQIDELQRRLQAPAIAILPPGTVHAFSFTDETHGFVLTVAAETLYASPDAGSTAGALFSSAHLLPLVERTALAARLTRLLELLLQEFHCPDGADSPVCAWLARSVLWLVARELLLRHELDCTGDVRQLQRFARFQAAMETHFLDHWPVHRYARMLGVTVGQLNRACQLQRGRSAFELLQERIALEARRRLGDITTAVTQVAGELGFSDPAYFCRFFKRHAGVSPGTFRRRQARLLPVPPADRPR